MPKLSILAYAQSTQFCAVYDGVNMNIGNVAYSPVVKPLAAQPIAKQNPTIQQTSPSEEAKESPQVRAQETGKGTSVNTFA